MRLAGTFAAFLLAASLATASYAAEPEAVLVAQLEKAGYTIEIVSTTLLGRIRIDATRDGIRREIVINPRTGEILRDFEAPILFADNESSGSGMTPLTEPTATEVPAATAVLADPSPPVGTAVMLPEVLSTGTGGAGGN